MTKKTYYAINSDLGYIKGINIDGSLSLGSGNVVKNMSEDKAFVKKMFDAIEDHTEHVVSLEEISVNIKEIE